MRVAFLFLVLVGQMAFAGDAKSKAAARVDVALALLEIADSGPELKNKPPRTGEVPVPPVETVVELGDPTPIKSPVPRIEWLTQTKSTINIRPVVTIYTGEAEYGKGWCRNCPKAKAAFGDGNDRVEIQYSDAKVPDSLGLYPAIRFVSESGEISFPADKKGNYRVPESLEELADIVERNTASRSYEASGPAGAINASSQIEAFIANFRQYVGGGNSVQFSWSRNGAQTLPLLHMADWSPKDLFGSDGRFEIASPNASNLPIREVAFNYQLRGQDLVIAPDPVRIPGLVNKLHLSQRGYSAGYGIIGIDDALFIWSVVSMVRDIAALLQPSIDVEIPSEVVSSLTLHGNTLDVTFDKFITVKATWLFTFRLGVQKVSITTSNIHVDFSGSRWVKSRDFVVQ